MVRRRHCTQNKGKKRLRERDTTGRDEVSVVGDAVGISDQWFVDHEVQ